MPEFQTDNLYKIQRDSWNLYRNFMTQSRNVYIAGFIYDCPRLRFTMYAAKLSDYIPITPRVLRACLVRGIVPCLESWPGKSINIFLFFSQECHGPALSTKLCFMGDYYSLSFREIDDMIQDDYTPDSEGSLLDDSVAGRCKQALPSPLYEESEFFVTRIITQHK